MVERGPGRPRDPKLDDAIATAARDVMLSRGYIAASYAEIARRAGVGTPAVYRRWPTKTQMAVSLVEHEYQADPIPTTGSIRRDLAAFIRLRIANFETPMFHQVLLPVAIESRADDEGSRWIRDWLASYRRPSMIPRIRKAILDGELRPDTDPELLINMLMGTLGIPAVFAGRMPRKSEAQAIVDQLLEGFIARKKKRTRRRAA